MKRLLIVLSWLLFSIGFALLAEAVTNDRPDAIIKSVGDNFALIKDAEGPITLDTGLQLLGCGGMIRQTGYAWFKYPDRLKIEISGDTYFVKGNSIRKIAKDGKKYYVTLIHAPDFTPGFIPELIPYNFNLKIAGQTSQEVVIDGQPKPGVLKNVVKVIFYINTKDHLIDRMKMLFQDKKLSGYAEIKYQHSGRYWIPIATTGKSAIEMGDNSLVGLKFGLAGTNFKINTGLSNALFDAGF